MTGGIFPEIRCQKYDFFVAGVVSCPILPYLCTRKTGKCGFPGIARESVGVENPTGRSRGFG
jgi:hypothetical protein